MYIYIVKCDSCHYVHHKKTGSNGVPKKRVHVEIGWRWGWEIEFWRLWCHTMKIGWDTDHFIPTLELFSWFFSDVLTHCTSFLKDFWKKFKLTIHHGLCLVKWLLWINWENMCLWDLTTHTHTHNPINT